MPNNDKSEAAKKMRSGSEEERSRAASEMGRAGGQARGGNQGGGNQGGGNRGGGNQGGGRRKEMDPSEAASILGRDDSTEEEKREAARILGREGGRNSRGGND